MSNIKTRHAWEALGRLAALGVLLFYTLLALLPMYLMATSSLSAVGSSFGIEDIRLLPTRPSLENFARFNTRVGGDVARWFLNSLLVATLPVASSIFFGALAGYALSKHRFPGRELLFWSIICTMTIPFFVVIIPLYEMVWQFRWIDSYQALIVPSLAGIGTIFLARQFMQTLPTSLIESAIVDGCDEFGVFRHIILPMIRPLLAVLAIIGFVAAWGDYFWPYLVTNSRSMYTIQMGIMGAIGVDGQYAGEMDYGEIMAISLLASIPVIILFLVAQKHFVKGLTIGAVKG